jgi:hypothetical protein
VESQIKKTHSRGSSICGRCNSVTSANAALIDVPTPALWPAGRRFFVCAHPSPLFLSLLVLNSSSILQLVYAQFSGQNAVKGSCNRSQIAAVMDFATAKRW